MLTRYPLSRCARQLIAIAATISLAANALAQCHYTYQLIPKPPGWLANPGLSMNNHGHVAGISHGGDTHLVYVWTPETGNVILARPPGIISMESAFINDTGHVAGAMFSYVGGVGTWYGYYWDGSAYTIMNLPDWAISLDVEGLNNNGQVVGTLSSGFPPLRAFVWQAGVFSDIGPIISEFTTHGEGIADSGTVVGRGYEDLDPPYDYHGFALSGQMSTWLSSPFGWSSEALAINNNNIAVGIHVTALPGKSGGRALGAIWSDVEVAVVSPPPGTRSAFMTAVNDAGRAVGYYYLGQFPTNAAITWQNGLITDLNDLLVPQSPTRVNSVRAINRSGQILAGIGATNAVLTPHWIPGDVSGDCHVTLEDLALVLTNFGSPLGAFPRGDVDLDGDVDLTDLATVLTHWGS